MEFLANNGYWILAAVIAIAFAGVAIWKFSQLPSAEQVAQVKVWLLEACTQVEKELTSEAGKDKLQLVYTRFEQQFPRVALAVSFETFSKWVDSALEELKEALESDTNKEEEVV
ncbi:phage holin, LLH family [Chakrabartyella piscis]|uniref:phage holin, LLH family n=1 Tax=Chakrabartyella piscis TaxID=2918914 RepID=UPI0029587778|nr:hypothetical protein [Chakrabartyella piscis]